MRPQWFVSVPIALHHNAAYRTGNLARNLPHSVDTCLSARFVISCQKNPWPSFAGLNTNEH